MPRHDEALDPELVSDLGAELETRGDVIAAELEAARAEADALREKAARAQAEFENARRRLQATHDDAVKRAAERVVESLLPVVDDLERAIDHAVGAAADVVDGLEAVRRKLLDVLAREGCTPIDPFGAAFDASRHHAVQQRADTDVPDGTVVEVFQTGYEMHGRVLRSAMVAVSTGGPARPAE